MSAIGRLAQAAETTDVGTTRTPLRSMRAGTKLNLGWAMRGAGPIPYSIALAGDSHDAWDR